MNPKTPQAALLLFDFNQVREIKGPPSRFAVFRKI